MTTAVKGRVLTHSQVDGALLADAILSKEKVKVPWFTKVPWVEKPWTHWTRWENPSNPMESHQNHWKLDKDGEGGERLDFFRGLFWGLVDLVV